MGESQDPRKQGDMPDKKEPYPAPGGAGTGTQPRPSQPAPTTPLPATPPSHSDK